DGAGIIAHLAGQFGPGAQGHSLSKGRCRVGIREVEGKSGARWGTSPTSRRLPGAQAHRCKRLGDLTFTRNSSSARMVSRRQAEDQDGGAQVDHAAPAALALGLVRVVERGATFKDPNAYTPHQARDFWRTIDQGLQDMAVYCVLPKIPAEIPIWEAAAGK